MAHRYHAVNKTLSEYVRSILVIDNNADSDPASLPLFLNGVPALVCEIGENRHQVLLFGGSIAENHLTVKNNVFLLFFFHPFLLGPVFKLPAQRLKEGLIGLDQWSPQKNIALNLQLTNAVLLPEKMEILTHFVLAQATANRHEYLVVRQATDELLQDPRSETLAGLHKELNLTERTFQRIFKKYVGIAPNEYRRICQFQMAFFQLKGGHYNKIADVAYDHGYFDQSHYIRSFKEFVHTTPNEYLQFGLRKK